MVIDRFPSLAAPTISRALKKLKEKGVRWIPPEVHYLIESPYSFPGQIEFLQAVADGPLKGGRENALWVLNKTQGGRPCKETLSAVGEISKKNP